MARNSEAKVKIARLSLGYQDEVNIELDKSNPDLLVSPITSPLVRSLTRFNDTQVFDNCRFEDVDAPSILTSKLSN